MVSCLYRVLSYDNEISPGSTADLSGGLLSTSLLRGSAMISSAPAWTLAAGIGGAEAIESFSWRAHCVLNGDGNRWCLTGNASSGLRII